MPSDTTTPELPHENLAARIALHQAVQSTPDVTLTINQAALFLGCHPKKLARWRNEERPPLPVNLNSEDKQGVEVRYRVGTLQDFVRQSRVASPSPESAGYKSEVVTDGKREAPSSMRWSDGSNVAAEDIEVPFFVGGHGLVLAYGWEDDVTIIAERLLSPSIGVSFMSWDSALAGVWQDEDRRLSWLAHADSVAPDLRAAVAQKRQAQLTKT